MKSAPLAEELLDRIVPEDLKLLINKRLRASVPSFADFDWRMADKKTSYFLDYRQRLWEHMNNKDFTKQYTPFVKILETRSGNTTLAKPVGERGSRTIKEELRAQGQTPPKVEATKDPVTTSAVKEGKASGEKTRVRKMKQRASGGAATEDALKKKLLTREGISETLSKKNAEKLAGWAKARPAWVKLAVGTGLAIGAIGVINRAAVGNSHPPDDVERAWARIEKIKGRMADQRRQDWSDFGSPWGGKSGKRLVAALGGQAVRNWTKRGMALSSIEEKTKRVFSTKRVIPMPIVPRHLGPGATGSRAVRWGALYQPVHVPIASPTQAGPRAMSIKVASLPRKPKATQIATNHPEKQSVGLIAWSRRQRHYYVRSDKDSHLFGG